MAKSNLDTSDRSSAAEAPLDESSDEELPPRRRYRLCWIRCSVVLFCLSFWILVGLGLARLFS